MRYVADHTGGTTGAESGRKYKYVAGEPFEAPAGEFPHVDGITPVAKAIDGEFRIASASETHQATEADPSADNEFDKLPEDAEFPYHYGGGNYFLSDGSKVRGKPEATEAQKAIDG